jgi:predicted nucleic acid-binding protein
LGTPSFEVIVSVPLLLEYEAALVEQVGETPITRSDIDDVLDYLCITAQQQEIFFLWRPLLRDPKDDMVLEVAVAGGCSAIISYNVRDFAGAEQFALRVLRPADFLEEIGGWS